MTKEEIRARLEKLHSEMTELAAKRDKAEGDKVAFYTEELEAKQAEFTKAEGKAAEIHAATEREAAIAKLTEKPEIESKKGSLEETVTVPNSEHNEAGYQAKKDKLAADWLTAPWKQTDRVLAKADGRLMGEVFDGVGVKVPSYMRNYIVNGDAALGAKTEYPMLVSDATGSQSGGGAGVPTMFVPELFKYKKIEAGLLPRCTVKRAVGKDADFPRLDQSSERYGVTATWDAEGDSASESDPVINLITINCDRLALLAYMSDKMLRNNQVAIEAELAWMLRGEFTYQVDIHIIRGTRTNFYGIASINGYTAGVYRQGRETANQVSYTDLVNLEYKINAGNRADGVYIVSGGSTGSAKYMKALDDGTYGKPVMYGQAMGPWQPEGRPVYGAKVNTYDMIETEANNRALGARGDVIFGDIKAFGVAVDLDMTIARSDEIEFKKALSTFRLLAYLGGRPIGGNAFAVLDDVSGVSSSSSSST